MRIPTNFGALEPGGNNPDNPQWLQKFAGKGNRTWEEMINILHFVPAEIPVQTW